MLLLLPRSAILQGGEFAVPFDFESYELGKKLFHEKIKGDDLLAGNGVKLPPSSRR